MEHDVSLRSLGGASRIVGLNKQVKRRLILEVSDLSVCFGPKEVISRFCLLADNSSVTLLAGANGAGKSTVIRAIAGLVPYHGQITFDGVDLKNHTSADRHQVGIGYLPQQNGVFLGLSVYENFSLASHGGVSSPDEVFNFPCPNGTWPDLWSKRASSLSIGQQRSLAAAMVLVRRPKIALLDEPFAGLAGDAAENLGFYLKESVLNEGLTLIIVDHNLQLSSAIADHVYVIRDGVSRELPSGISAAEIAVQLITELNYS
jgi:branched-chain amino acid transport system ATP-binding protein